MGAGLTLAASVARTTGEKTVGFIGDSTFFHSGMPALLNTVRQGADTLTVILDNEVTAMTGFQESPSTPVAALVQTGRARSATDIETIVRALGVTHIETVDPEDLPAALAAFQRARDQSGPTVVITRRPCPVSLGRVISAGGVASAPDTPREAAPGTAPDSDATGSGTTDSSSGTAPQPTTFAISQDLCRTCGREDAGQRCDQQTLAPFERAMARARSLEVIQPGACDSGGADSCGSCKPGTVATHRGERPTTAPCASLCPLHLCIQGYAAHIASGDYAQALELILDGLPLPDSVCRVCHRPCEDVCVRGDLDQPVAINDLKRFVMDWAAGQEEFPLAPESARCEAEHGGRVALVGAGPAGLAAAHGLRRRGYIVDLFDAREQAGGLLRYGIPAYRLPLEALERDVERIMEMGVRFHGGRSLGADLELDSLMAEYDGVLLTLGAGQGRRLDIPLAVDSPEGEGAGGAPQVADALTWLGEEEAAAASHVLVIGGGNSAIDAARTALRRGAASVTVSCLEERSEMPAISEEIAEAQAEGVEFRQRTRVRRLLAGQVEIVSVKPRTTGILDPASFDELEGSATELQADLLILAVGQVPERDLLEGGGLYMDGIYLSIDPHTGATSREGLFAAGDLTGGEGTVTGSIAAGLRAAWGLDCALRGDRAASPPPPIPPNTTNPPPGRPGVERTDRSDGRGQRRRPPELEDSERHATFNEVVGTLTEEAARAEAARCMICGLCGNCRSCLDLFGCPAFYLDDAAIEIDPHLCVSCGVCAEFCPNEAIYPVYAQDLDQGPGADGPGGVS
jgi:NADH-quinone oxidoreductase subunit F